MEVKTYRARSMQEALELVRRELGPEAAVLQTRDVTGRFSRWFSGSRQIEVTASNDVNVPSRFALSVETDLSVTHRPVGDEQVSERLPAVPDQEPSDRIPYSGELFDEAARREPTPHEEDFRVAYRQSLENTPDDLPSVIEELCRQPAHRPAADLPTALFDVLTDLIDAEVHEETAQELVQRLQDRVTPEDGGDPLLLRARLARMVEEEVVCRGPIRVVPGHRKLVALVGPTGVGKTTTIAKLAANFHLRDRCRVGLITVDTYRIAAAEQLRTYADIIDLPMEIVSTPREMRDAANRLSDLDLVLMDTAGRSPGDDVKIQELKSMLTEAQPDEVHLVLSGVASTKSMANAVRRFSQAGATSLVLTKLDEATGLGSLLPTLRGSNLPVSYVTHGQNVPDDIAPADRRTLARMVLGMEAVR